VMKKVVKKKVIVRRACASSTYSVLSL
jgi:hypothetical protein